MLKVPLHLGFPGGSDSKESTCNSGDLGLIPGLGRSPGEGNGYQFNLIQAGFRKGGGTRDQIANIHWIIEKARVPEKHLFLLY